jgi:2-polyprenyl-6-methoxyphenol hydroxylase-like FAD-dependent oxidoreductase
MNSFDHIIIGGGIFGCYASVYLAKKGKRVALIEKESALFQKASIVNQARLHSGYHYPRSVATAMMSDDNKARFTEEHRALINFEFEKYYAIDRFGSFTDARQFERFCRHIDIRCDRVGQHPLFNFDRIEALYLTTEYSFDPLLIAQYYRNQLAGFDNIHVFLNTAIQKVQKNQNEWQLALSNKQHLTTNSIINATYTASNAINQLFGVQEIQLMHEISEMCFVTSPQLQNLGLTVMDGPFGSLMPYGKSGLLSLSSVAYTHHKVSYDNLPTFDCQQQNTACRPDFSSICNTCAAKPTSAKHKMLGQMAQYFTDAVELHYASSFFTIKSKLKANAIDDGRPTEISILHQKPDFYCLFAGKINSIYEIEKLL